MDWNAVLELVVTVVFLAGIALALLCLVTIHRNPYFSEVQKLKWLLLVLCLRKIRIPMNRHQAQ